MMPIVFWASFVPWPRLYAAADTSWSRRNTRSASAGLAVTRLRIPTTMNATPRRKPTTGDTTMKRTIRRSPGSTSAPHPAFVTAAPASPAMRACDELVGRPKYQVTRPQTNAAARPAKMTAPSTTDGSTTPLPIVVATATPKKNAATKLKNAAQATACIGVRTRVPTTVAIEFAASWKPFMKSNASATPIRRTRTPSPHGGGSRDSSSTVSQQRRDGTSPAG